MNCAGCGNALTESDEALWPSTAQTKLCGPCLDRASEALDDPRLEEDE